MLHDTTSPILSPQKFGWMACDTWLYLQELVQLHQHLFMSFQLQYGLIQIIF